MSECYWITGVQLGILIALDSHKQRQDIINEIVDKQFIGNTKDLKEEGKK